MFGCLEQICQHPSCEENASILPTASGLVKDLTSIVYKLFIAHNVKCLRGALLHLLLSKQHILLQQTRCKVACYIMHVSVH